MRFSWAVLCLAGLFGAVLAAEDGYPLRKIDIAGAEHFDPDRVRDLTGLEIGSIVTPVELQKGLERINDAGVFESVEYRYGPFQDGFVVTYTVEEARPLFRVRLEGFDSSEEELRGLLREHVPLFRERVPDTGPMVRRIGDTLERHWKETGHESEIIGRLVPVGNDEFEMLYSPQTRAQNIAFVKLEGVSALPPLELQRKFNMAAMGEAYSEGRLEELLHYNVRPLYEAVGRMNVEFCPCSAEPDPKTEGLIVAVQVNEGPEYHYGSIELPETPVVEAEKRDEMFPLERGELVNLQAAREALGKYEEALRRKGFLKSQTNLDTNVDHEARTVDLKLEADPGVQYVFRRLEIEGLDLLAEPVIRKRWGMQPGDPFNPTYPGFFLDRIRAEQMFDRLADTKAEVNIDETEHAVDVTLRFFGEAKEKPPLPEEKPELPF